MFGYGGSDCLFDGVVLLQFVDWLLVVFDVLGLDQVNFVGYLMGVLIVGGFVVMYLVWFEWVVLLNGVFCWDVVVSVVVKVCVGQIKQGVFDLEMFLNCWFGEMFIELDVCVKVVFWLLEV